MPASDQPDKSSSPGEHAPQDAAVLALVRELAAQRLMLQEEHKATAAERRSEKRWRIWFQALVFGVPALLGMVYFLFFLGSTGFRWGPFFDTVAVVRLDGEIAPGKPASADVIVPLLEKSMSNPQVKGVVISIDSGGGSPVEAERIYNTMNALREKHRKQIIAVVNGVGASAAYLIAIHADMIVAGKYSLVGSIGAVMAPWELDKALANLNIRQRVYASGKLKAFGNPFAPVTPEAVEWGNRLVATSGGLFLSEVRTLRPNLSSNVDLSTGEVWAGIHAKELGLVDEIGTLEEVIASHWGLKPYDYGPQPASKGWLSGIVGSVAAGLVPELTMLPALR